MYPAYATGWPNVSRGLLGQESCRLPASIKETVRLAVTIGTTRSAGFKVSETDKDEAWKLLQQLLQVPGFTRAEFRFSHAAMAFKSLPPEAIQQGATIADEAGWLISRSANGHLAIESPRPPVMPVLPGSELFHVSDRSARDEILQEGLQPRTGGNTSFGRGYPPRVHLCIRFAAAIMFVRHQTTARAPFQQLMETLEAASPRIEPRELEDLDIYAVTIPGGVTFFEDSHFENGGVWTESAISNTCLRLLEPEEWQPLYSRLYPPPPSLAESIGHMLMPGATIDE